jgi:glycosidase
MDQIHAHLSFLYGDDRARAALQRMRGLFRRHLDQWSASPCHAAPLNEADSVLITYGDQVRAADEMPLQTLQRFLQDYLSDAISAVHILPFFPYSSDEGFSVIDYRRVNPAIGNWEHVEAIADDFRLMVDAVINHISSQSAWFQGFLQGESPYDEYFIPLDPDADLSHVVRPRVRPLLTPVETSGGKQHVWTTFSPDQIDLNFQNPEVLLQIIDILLSYIRHGAQIIRLDAIAFLWKVPGTSSIHLPQTHVIVKLLRAVMDAISPWVMLITETNVPHEENISYFGSGEDEAHLVYNFALPPLVLHTMLTGNASRLSSWASNLSTPSKGTAFFNFLASHDGIGLRPVEGLLRDEEIENLVHTAKARGGRISYRALSGCDRSPYEINITYADALAPPEEWHDPASPTVDRYICSQAILLSLRGLPAIYFHSLVGSRNDQRGVEETGEARAINRERLLYPKLASELAHPASNRARIFSAYRHLLITRRGLPAFNPHGEQQILDLLPNVFAVIRSSPDGAQQVLCLHEIAGQQTSLPTPRIEGQQVAGMDRLSGERISQDTIAMAAYQNRWIELDREAE